MNGSFFRYPGGKHKLKWPILCEIVRYGNKPYLELFCGGACIAVEHRRMQPRTRVWLNDADPGIAALWTSVLRRKAELKYRIRHFKPTPDAFFTIRDELRANTVTDDVELGFRKLAIHQMSYSGLGVKAAGPIGGKDQRSAYPVDCRWSPDYLCKKIDYLSSLLTGARVTALDFEAVIDGEHIVYCDPPYFKKGGELYQHSFSRSDHVRLRDRLRQHPAWVLSYDDHPEIRAMYAFARIKEYAVSYSINGATEKKELVICAP